MYNFGAGEDLVPESTCQMETGESRTERRRRRCRFGGGSHDGLQCFWTPQWCHGTTHFRYKNRGADTGACEPFSGQIASPSSGEVRESTTRETDAFERGWVLGSIVVSVGRCFGTSEYISEFERSGTATSGRRDGGGNRGRGWSKGLCDTSTSSRSRILRKVVNVANG